MPIEYPDRPNLSAVAATMEVGVLPNEGGLLDQPADFVDDLMVAMSERAKMAEEMKQQAKERAEHGR